MGKKTVCDFSKLHRLFNFGDMRRGRHGRIFAGGNFSDYQVDDIQSIGHATFPDINQYRSQEGGIIEYMASV
jgi:hypothetical protein